MPLPLANAAGARRSPETALGTAGHRISLMRISWDVSGEALNHLECQQVLDRRSRPMWHVIRRCCAVQLVSSQDGVRPLGQAELCCGLSSTCRPQREESRVRLLCAALI